MKKCESFGRHISCLYRYAQGFLEKELARLDLGGSTYAFILLLSHKKNLNLHQLSRELHVDKATTSRAVKKLLTLDYIKKEIDPGDQRAYHISLTEKGKQTVPKVRKTLESWTRIISKNFTEIERNEANRLLKKMVENAIQFKNSNETKQQGDSKHG